jgi:hypothetical protein
VEDGVVVGPRGIVRRLRSEGVGTQAPRFSICTMVTRWDEYRGCVQSFRNRGFDDACCEFLVIDNSTSNRADAYVATNEFLQSARGDYVVLCHQDVVLLQDGRDALDQSIAALDVLDPQWGLCGNAGHTDDGWPAICISHPHGEGEQEIAGGPFPTRVVSLDENFIVVRRLANLAVSRDLAGFHHYGPDLCIVADVLGWNAYVIGFFLRHNSGGTLDEGYHASRRAITAKYVRAFRPRWMHLITRHPFHISGHAHRNVAARALRRLQRQLRLIPTNSDLDDPAQRRRRDARRAVHPIAGNGRHD